ncbi:6-phosphogluconolactonase [Bacillus sp. FJAT-49732]|uniref:6-phosphogluconolactonase n=1 Tax=Lederbergia citrisecunda TaxID=2833583 RepID=A0A942YL63_9BACI|nr:6-phosphogluconolactonase [Lederbergia citrisecunda]MBS4199310.1 6-phosphogluconolactonase [Lederbergia citrisecunda]
MEIIKCQDAVDLGVKSAEKSAQIINEAINEKGSARIVLSTGKSQLETLNHMISQPIQWEKVEMFHLDEYINLPENHPASFRKYLKERFTSKLPLKKAHFIDSEGNVGEMIKQLNEEISKESIDLGIIGIGENCHIAFNDPPADFQTKEPFIIVNLDQACKEQQVGEGWFSSIDVVPPQAITMSVHQILQCRCIVSPVPFLVKAEAIKNVLESEKITNQIPATILRSHPNCTLYLDQDSGSLIKEKVL